VRRIERSPWRTTGDRRAWRQTYTLHRMTAKGNHDGCDAGCGDPSPTRMTRTEAVAPGMVEPDVRAAAACWRPDPRLLAAVPGFDAPCFQAGLAGYSDAAMRIVARRRGCPFCVTEALLDRPLLAGGRGFDKADLEKQHRHVPGGDEDHPLAGQIIGSDPWEMAKAALLLADAGFDVIDVNLACPVKKIARKCRGGHFLAHPDEAVQLLAEVRAAVPPETPCTVKLRRAWDDESESARAFERIFDAAYELGYAWATVHGRTVRQKYIGPSRWDVLRDLVVRYPDRLIFGSGDIWSASDVFRMMSYTGVYAVSVARGCIGNPWVFRQVRQLMAGEEPTPPSVEEQRDVLVEHFRLSMAVNGERLASRMMRKFGIMFSHHHPQSRTVRDAFIRVSSRDDWRAVIDTHYGVRDSIGA
jgi:tRNA-dihydrouridine synthase B